MNLLKMSFSGAVLIIAIVIIRTAAINKLPKRTFLVLWELVLVKLLIPFSVPFLFSVYTFIPALSGTDNAVSSVLPEQLQTMQTQLPADPVQTVSGRPAIWCIGMVLCGTFFLISYLHCLMKFQTSHPVNNGYVKQWLTEHPLKRPLSIRQSDQVFSPLTYGIFRPVILMPQKTDWRNAEQLQYILLHEYVHVRHFDAVIKLISIFALCIHWFNPLVWVMYILFNRDIELFCDENVVRKAGETSRSAYALTLIDMETKKSGLSPLCNHFSKNAIEERITAIMKTKKATTASILLSIIIVLAAAVIFATSAVSSAHEKVPTVTPDHNQAAQSVSEDTRGSEQIPVNEADSYSVFDVDANQSNGGCDAFSPHNVKSGQYALGEVIYEINEDITLFHYSINWAPMGNYIQVGLMSVDKGDFYSVSCVGGTDSRKIDISQIPAGSYYVMVYNEASSDMELNGTIVYDFN